VHESKPLTKKTKNPKVIPTRLFITILLTEQLKGVPARAISTWGKIPMSLEADGNP
jgi:hypothetical protein